MAGELGFGSQSNDRIDVKIAQTSNIGVHCSFKISKQILPFAYTFGWNMGGWNTTSGGFDGYSFVNVIFSSKHPPSHGVDYGLQILHIGYPKMTASHSKMLFSRGAAIKSS